MTYRDKAIEAAARAMAHHPAPPAKYYTLAEIALTAALPHMQKPKPSTGDSNGRASVIPCYRGGHHCSWPACASDCDGRPGATAAHNPSAEDDERARRMIPTLLFEQYPEIADELNDSIARALAAARLEGARAENEACVWRFANRG